MLIAFKSRLFVSPPVALMAVLLGTGCVVALGLLLGTLSNNPSTVGMWGVVALLSLAALTGAAFLVPAAWPAALRSFLSWLPGAATINLLRYSMSASPPGGMLWTSVASLTAAAAATYALAGVLLRRTNS